MSMPKNRLEAFTDAVIAIIMTILVLELHVPQSDTFQALTALGFRIVIYIVSFFTLGIYWNNHHHLFQAIHKINGRTLWANSFFLFALSLFPFATSWISEYVNRLAPEVTYGFVTLGANVAYYLLMRTLVETDKDNKNFIKTLLGNYKKSYLSMGLNVLGILLGFWLAPIAVLIVNLFILVAWLIPSRKIEAYFH